MRKWTTSATIALVGCLEACTLIGGVDGTYVPCPAGQTWKASGCVSEGLGGAGGSLPSTGGHGGSSTTSRSSAFDSGTVSDSGVDSGPNDSGVDSGPNDSGPPAEGGVQFDSGSPIDSGSATDSGAQFDGGPPKDSGVQADSGNPDDSGTPMDGGVQADGGSPSDGGTPADSGPCIAGFTDCGGTVGCVNLQTDEGHCNACLSNCNRVGSCDKGQCVPLAGYVSAFVSEIAVNGSTLYYIDPNYIDQGTPAGAIYKVDSSQIVAGGYLQRATVVSGFFADKNFTQLAVDSAGDLFWVETSVGDAGADSHRSTVRMLRNGETTPVTLATDQDYPSNLVVVGTTVYWLQTGVGKVTSVDTQTDAGAHDLVSGRADTTNGFIAVDSTRIYWSEPNYTQLMTIPIDGGSVTKVADPNPGATQLHLYDGRLYFYTNWGQIGYVTANATYQTPTYFDLSVFNLATAGGGMAIDSSGIYLALGSDPAVVRLALDGTAFDWISTGTILPRRIVTTPSMVFWVDAQVLYYAPK